MEKRTFLSQFIILCLYISCIMCVVTIPSAAKYTTNAEGLDNARVAIFEAGIKNITINGSTMKPGDTKEFSLDITNFEGSRTSEVVFTYIIKIKTNGYLPLEIEYKSSTPTPNANEINKGNIVINNLDNSYKWSLWANNETIGKTGSLPAKTAKTHHYTFTVKWPAEENNYLYKDEIDLITITIDAKQKAVN